MLTEGTGEDSLPRTTGYRVPLTSQTYPPSLLFNSLGTLGDSGSTAERMYASQLVELLCSFHDSFSPTMESPTPTLTGTVPGPVRQMSAGSSDHPSYTSFRDRLRALSPGGPGRRSPDRKSGLLGEFL